jgi:hypothetical protein
MSEQQFVWIAERRWSSYEKNDFLGVYESMGLAQMGCRTAHMSDPNGPYKRASRHLFNAKPVFTIDWGYEAEDYDDTDSYGNTWTTGIADGYEYVVTRHEVRSLA